MISESFNIYKQNNVYTVTDNQWEVISLAVKVNRFSVLQFQIFT